MSIRSSNFRDDINGLRAWAVVAVILYHFGITGFSGGFVGVDIFFVISGFLMTGIIVGELEKTSKSQGNARFSLINFYISRARRIIPALLTLCIALIIAGWFFLSSLEYKALGSQVVSAIGFFPTSNSGVRMVTLMQHPTKSFCYIHGRSLSSGNSI